VSCCQRNQELSRTLCSLCRLASIEVLRDNGSLLNVDGGAPARDWVEFDATLALKDEVLPVLPMTERSSSGTRGDGDLWDRGEDVFACA
jgi:hypothetical protein